MGSVMEQNIFQDVSDDIRGLPGFQVRSVNRDGKMMTLFMDRYLDGQ